MPQRPVGLDMKLSQLNVGLTEGLVPDRQVQYKSSSSLNLKLDLDNSNQTGVYSNLPPPAHLLCHNKWQSVSVSGT